MITWTKLLITLPTLCTSHLMPRQSSLSNHPNIVWRRLLSSALISRFKIFLEHGTQENGGSSVMSLHVRNIRDSGHPIFFTKHRDSDECTGKEVRTSSWRNAKMLAKDAAQASASETQQPHRRLQPQVPGKWHFLPTMTHWNGWGAVAAVSCTSLIPHKSQSLPVSYPDEPEQPVASSAPQSPGSIIALDHSIISKLVIMMMVVAATKFSGGSLLVDAYSLSRILTDLSAWTVPY
jgi:hypothetical protein